MDEPCCLEGVRRVIKKVSLKSALGPSSLRFGHLQDALKDELVGDVANFAKLVLPNSSLPDLFWVLRTAANLWALGAQTRPVTCRDVMRGGLGATFCR